VTEREPLSEHHGHSGTKGLPAIRTMGIVNFNKFIEIDELNKHWEKLIKLSKTPHIFIFSIDIRFK